MLNFTFALLALAAFCAFFGVVIWFVPHVDLVIAILIGLALATWDMVSQLARRGS